MSFDFSDIARTLARDENFGEEVVYGKASGVERTIRGAVKRVPAQTMPEDGRVLRPYIELTVENNVTTGITLGELETSTDYVKIAVRIGGTAETLSIARVLRQANGFLVLEIR